MKRLFNYRIDVLAVGILLVLALLPRVIGLGTFLTSDEKTWLGRSYEFIRAFKDVRFNDMLQTTHPGVTTLWTSGIAMSAKMFLSDIPFTNDTLFHFIKSSQFAIASLNALAIPFIYILLLLVCKRRDVAFFSALLIALDPLLIGYSRVVHVDALLGSFLTLAVLASILYARSLKRGWLIASAVLAALALLTKFPAVFIFPFILFALFAFYVMPDLIGHLRRRRLDSRLRGNDILFLKDRFRDALTWVLLVGLLILIIWPALLWVPNPVGNVLQLKRDISIAAVTPHNMDEEYSLKIYHYPAALISRSNPISLIGGLLGCIAIGLSIFRKKTSPEMLLVAVYLLGFIVMMTLGAKKGDRYILPVFFALDILAAYGILWAITVMPGLTRHPRLSGFRLTGRNDTSNKMPSVGKIVVCLLSTAYLLFVIISYHPYAVAYSNPFFPDNISQELGWGEGLEQVAQWLNINYPGAIVASWYPGELGVYTNAPVLHINAHTQNQVRFIVLYKNMFGRDPSHYANDFIDEYYKKREPVFIAHVAGKEFAWVYEKPSYSKTIGDLDAQTIVVQEVTADYENLSGIQILPATRFGEAKTGTLSIAISRTLHGETIFTKQVPMTALIDASWYNVDFPEGKFIAKGEHLFITIRGLGSATPYASVRYAQEPFRSTPIYISRTGNERDASMKPGSLAVQLMYTNIEGKISNELETRLLK